MMASPLWRLIRLLAAAAAVVLAAPSAHGVVADDPAFSQQWALPLIGAPAAWQAGTGEGIVIAVIDTGIDLAHEDLVDKLVDGHNVLEAGPPRDDNGHGTHVAGIAAAATGNGVGIAGVAPGARIMPVRVLRNECDGSGRCVATGNTRDVVAGIRWAVDNGAHIVNLSLGENVVIRSVLGSQIRDGLNYAWQRGVIPVVAAGNDALVGSGYAGINAVVVVATDRSDRLAWYSNTASSPLGSARWAISAPGGSAQQGAEADDILSTYWAQGRHNQYAFSAGTSMAVPHVSGAAAILRSLGLGPQETVDRLLSTAADVGASSTYGAGRLDLARATDGLGRGDAAAPGAHAPAPAAQAPVPAAQPPEPAARTPAPEVAAPPRDESSPPAPDPSATEAGEVEPDPAARAEEPAVQADVPGDEPRGSAVPALLGLAAVAAALGAGLVYARVMRR